MRQQDCAMYLTDKLKGAMFDPDYTTKGEHSPPHSLELPGSGHLDG